LSSLVQRKFWAANLACLISPLVLGGAPLAHAANNVGWVLVDQPNQTGAYTPDSAHSFNSAHGSITVNASETGQYQVYFNNLVISSSTPVDVQVTAYNSANRCTGGEPSMATSSNAYVDVQCVDSSGQPANSGFSLLYQSRSAPFDSASNALAYAQFTYEGEHATLNAYNSFNSRGGQNTAVESNKTGNSAGNYTVTLTGMTRLGGDVQVNGYTSTAQCKVIDWGAGSTATTITVQCSRTDNGLPTYASFNLAYAIGEPFGLVPGDATLGAWLWAQDPTSTAPYKPNPHFQYNGFRTGAMTAQKTSTGHYTVTIPGTLTYTSAIALATAYGPGNGYCNVAGWTGGTINVVCYNQTQAFADSRFNLTFQTAR